MTECPKSSWGEWRTNETTLTLNAKRLMVSGCDRHDCSTYTTTSSTQAMPLLIIALSSHSTHAYAAGPQDAIREHDDTSRVTQRKGHEM